MTRAILATLFTALALSGGLASTAAVAQAPDAYVPNTGTSGVAGPYPITRTVSGMTGLIHGMKVTLSGVFHTRPDDLDMLLVSPQGQAVTLMSDACGGSAVENVTWTWNDNALPMSDQEACPSGRQYQPSDYEGGENMPLPAPAGPSGPFLSTFDYTDPNGDWRLYVRDDQVGGFGRFVDRFTLDIRTRPPANVSFFPDVAIDVTEGEARELTLFRGSGGRGLGAGSVTVTSSPVSAKSGDDFEPVSTELQFAPGQHEKKVSVRALADSLPEGTEKFTLTVAQPTGDAQPDATLSTAVVTIQDRAPKPGPGGDPGGGGVPAVDRDAPVIGGVRLAPAAFGVGRRSTARAAARGTTIRYSLSERARVTLKLQRAVRGRRGRRRYIAAGALRRTGRAGRNRVAFSGRIGRRALRRGTYRLVVTAVDAAGNRSSSRPRGFRVVR